MVVELKLAVRHFDNLAADRLLDREELDQQCRFEAAVAAKTKNNHENQNILT